MSRVPSGDVVMTDQAKLDLLHDTRQAFGRTALILQGGAIFGLCHIGVVKALHLRGLLPRIIGGTATGALIAALVGVHTESELLDFLTGDAIDLSAFETARHGMTRRRGQRLNPPDAGDQGLDKVAIALGQLNKVFGATGMYMFLRAIPGTLLTQINRVRSDNVDTAGPEIRQERLLARCQGVGRLRTQKRGRRHIRRSVRAHQACSEHHCTDERRGRRAESAQLSDGS